MKEKWQQRVILSTLLIVIFFTCNALHGKKNRDQHIYSPLCIARGPEGKLLVSDYRTSMVLLVNRKNNRVTRRFAIDGKPLGVAYANGKVYVGNETLQRIEVYRASDKRFKKLGVLKGTVKKPSDMVIHRKSGKLYVVDGLERVVKVFNKKGKLKGTIPVNGPDPSLLIRPTGITIHRERGELLVSDYGDDTMGIPPRIQIFSLDGQFQDTIPAEGEVSAGASGTGAVSAPKMGMGGGWGSPEPRFSRPQGLAINKYGHIFLVDCYSSEILVFNRDTGVQIKSLGGYGEEPGQMRLPLDLVIDNKSGDIFVTNNRLARIEVFKAGGNVQ